MPRPKKDPKYLAWIREWPCWVCTVRLCRQGLMPANTFNMGSFRKLASLYGNPAEAAHVGVRGLGQKCPDRETLPLCSKHHRIGKDSHHVLGKKFWEHHQIDRDSALAYLQAIYSLEAKS